MDNANNDKTSDYDDSKDGSSKDSDNDQVEVMLIESTTMEHR